MVPGCCPAVRPLPDRNRSNQDTTTWAPLPCWVMVPMA